MSFHRDRSHVSLGFLPEFHAKTQSANRLSVPITIPALTNILAPDDEDRVLCPVRALSCYLRRTAPIRGTKRRLFISVNPRYGADIGKNTLARWLRSVVQRAYTASRLVLHDAVRAHETRAVSTTLAEAHGLSLETLMAAASWRAEATFTQHYLRDISQSTLDGSHNVRAAVLAQTALGL